MTATYTITLTETRRQAYKAALQILAWDYQDKGDETNYNFYMGLADELERAEANK